MLRYCLKASLVNPGRLAPLADGSEDLSICTAVHVRLSLPAGGPLCAHVERFRSTNRRNLLSAWHATVAAGFVAAEWLRVLVFIASRFQGRNKIKTQRIRIVGLNDGKQSFGLASAHPGWIPPTLKLVRSMKQHIIPAALVVDDRRRHAILQELLTMLLPPSGVRCFVVLPEGHILKRNDGSQRRGAAGVWLICGAIPAPAALMG